jgi:hypothetical protein
LHTDVGQIPERGCFLEEHHIPRQMKESISEQHADTLRELRSQTTLNASAMQSLVRPDSYTISIALRSPNITTHEIPLDNSIKSVSFV